MKRQIEKQIGILGFKCVLENCPNIGALLEDFNTGLTALPNVDHMLLTAKRMPLMVNEVNKVLKDIELELIENKICPLSHRETARVGEDSPFTTLAPILSQPSKVNLPEDKDERDVFLKDFRANRLVLTKLHKLVETEQLLTRARDALKYNAIALQIEAEHIKGRA